MIKKFFVFFILVSCFDLYNKSVNDLINRHKCPKVVEGILDLSKLNLSDLNGIEKIPNIDEVTCLILRDNKIISLTPLLNLVNNSLTSLDLASNKIKDLAPLIFFQALKTLFVENNKFDFHHLEQVVENLNLVELKADETNNILVIEGINTVKMNEDENFGTCSICLDENDQNLYSTNCLHLFHEECLSQHIKYRKRLNLTINCPYCRSNLK